VCAAKAEPEVSAVRIIAERIDFFIVILFIQAVESQRAFKPVIFVIVWQGVPIREAQVDNLGWSLFS
tara:strand:- start:1657 stop:1857 length:201 start_codon:yes stop_codon:yes gene_type:complete